MRLAKLRRLVPTTVPRVTGVYRSYLRAQSVFDRGGVTVFSPCCPTWGPRGEVRLPSRDLPTFPASSSSRNGGWPLSSSRGRTHGPPMAPGMPQPPKTTPLLPPPNGLGGQPAVLTCYLLSHALQQLVFCEELISFTYFMRSLASIFALRDICFLLLSNEHFLVKCRNNGLSLCRSSWPQRDRSEVRQQH